jgi:hypothetical protein
MKSCFGSIPLFKKVVQKSFVQLFLKVEKVLRNFYEKLLWLNTTFQKSGAKGFGSTFPKG